MSVAITNVDSFYINIAETNGVNVNARKFTVEFGAISGDELPVYFDKRPVSKGRGLIVLDYTTTTVGGVSPSSAANMQVLIEELLLSSGGGQVTRNIIYKTAGYEVKPTDDIVVCDGTFTISLHTANGYEGVQHVIKNEGSGTVTLAADGAELIDDANEQELIQYESLTIVSDDTNWQVI